MSKSETDIFHRHKDVMGTYERIRAKLMVPVAPVVMRTDVRTAGQRNGRTNGRTNGWTNGQTGGQTDRWKGERTLGQINALSPPHPLPASKAVSLTLFFLHR